MNYTSITFLAASLALTACGAAPASSAQDSIPTTQDPNAATDGHLGTIDPRTGAFIPMPVDVVVIPQNTCIRKGPDGHYVLTVQSKNTAEVAGKFRFILTNGAYSQTFGPFEAKASAYRNDDFDTTATSDGAYALVVESGERFIWSAQTHINVINGVGCGPSSK